MEMREHPDQQYNWNATSAHQVLLPPKITACLQDILGFIIATVAAYRTGDYTKDGCVLSNLESTPTYDLCYRNLLLASFSTKLVTNRSRDHFVALKNICGYFQAMKNTEDLPTGKFAFRILIQAYKNFY